MRCFHLFSMYQDGILVCQQCSSEIPPDPLPSKD